MDLPELAKYAAALLVVIAMIMALHWVLRRFFADGGKGRHTAMRRRDRRLGVVEAAQVGPRHRLLLVRRDDREHLLLIGGATELVIETDIAHVSEEADVRVRSIEPRLGEERGRETGSYRPADEFEPRVAEQRSPLSTPGFGLAGRDEDDDDEPVAGFGTGRREPDSVAGRERYGREDDDEDRSPFASLSSSPYGLDERGRDDERSPALERGERSGTDYHVIDDENDESEDERARRYARADTNDKRDTDLPDSTESRILSRFLKRDEP